MQSHSFKTQNVQLQIKLQRSRLQAVHGAEGTT